MCFGFFCGLLFFARCKLARPLLTDEEFGLKIKCSKKTIRRVSVGSLSVCIYAHTHICTHTYMHIYVFIEIYGWVGGIYYVMYIKQISYTNLSKTLEKAICNTMLCMI